MSEGREGRWRNLLMLNNTPDYSNLEEFGHFSHESSLNMPSTTLPSISGLGSSPKTDNTVGAMS